MMANPPLASVQELATAPEPEPLTAEERRALERTKSVKPGKGGGAADPIANLNEPAQRFARELSSEGRARLEKNLQPGDVPTEKGPLAAEMETSLKRAKWTREGRLAQDGELQAAAPIDAPPASARDPYRKLLALFSRRKAHWEIPRELMATVQYNALNGNECRTLAAICTFRSRETGLARPGHKALLRRLGKAETPNNRKQLKRAISGLISHGILWRKSPGRRGKPNLAAEYFVAQNQQHIDFILSMNGGQSETPIMGDSLRPPLGENE